MDEQVTNYFTFGVDSPLGKYYVEVTRESADECRHEMFRMFGTKWAFQYEEPYAEELPKHGLSKLPLVADDWGFLRLEVSDATT